MGALSDLTHRKFGLNLKVPRFFKNRGTVAVLLGIAIVFQAWIEEVTRASVTPLVTGFILWSFTASAVISGLLYERWTWCHNVCPLGAWSGVFAMSSMVEVRADPEKCVKSDCKGMYCYFGRDDKPGCPFKQVPKTMQSNRFCSTCGNCLKACPNDAISVRLRMPGSEVVAQKKIIIGSAIISVLAIGVVAFQGFVMTVPWARLREHAAGFPLLANDFILYGGFILASLFLAAVFFHLAAKLYSKLNRVIFDKEVYRYGLAFLPIGLMAHIGHNVGHLFNGYALLPGAIASNINDKNTLTVAEQVPNYGMWQTLEVVLVLIGLAISVVSIRAIAKRAVRQESTWLRVSIPFLFLAGIHTAIFVLIFLTPMVTRVTVTGVL